MTKPKKCPCRKGIKVQHPVTKKWNLCTNPKCKHYYRCESCGKPFGTHLEEGEWQRIKHEK